VKKLLIFEDGLGLKPRSERLLEPKQNSGADNQHQHHTENEGESGLGLQC